MFYVKYLLYWLGKLIEHFPYQSFLHKSRAFPALLFLCKYFKCRLDIFAETVIKGPHSDFDIIYLLVIVIL